MLRKIRLTFAIFFFVLITLLFLDFTGTLHAWFGWMAKIQFLPALLALNVGVVIILIALTLLFGRVYCSVICPLGVFQDVVSWLGKKRKKNRYSYSPALSWLRYGVLGVFILALIGGVGSLVALLAPYSSYGRIASNLFAPVYQWGNNLLALLAERADSYMFYSVDVWMKTMGTFVIAVLTFVILTVLAWRNGRTYCNTICPVGTVLGFFSRFSLLKPVIDTSKCNGCGLCARNCKAACIDSKNHKIDYSRCVVCMDCIGKCKKGAIRYERPHKEVQKPLAAEKVTGVSPEQVDNARRALSFSAQLSRPKQGVVSMLPGIGKEEGTLLLEGTLDSGKPGREGMKYRVAMRLISKGGKQNISAERGITLTQGREAWLVLSATTSYAASGTDFSGNRYKEVCDSLLNAATQHVQIKESHIASHRTFYDRVSLTLPSTEDDVLPTNERITRFTERESPALAALPSCCHVPALAANS